MLLGTLKAPFLEEFLDVGISDYSVDRRIRGYGISFDEGLIDDLQGTPICSCDGDGCQLIFEDGVQDHTFGVGLVAREVKWLQKELQRHLMATPVPTRAGIGHPTERFGG